MNMSGNAYGVVIK